MIIYKITNSINGKSYIGQTSRDLETRWLEHIKNSKYQDSVFYRALKKYGKEKFTIKVICYASTVQELNYRELPLYKNLLVELEVEADFWDLDIDFDKLLPETDLKDLGFDESDISMIIYRADDDLGDIITLDELAEIKTLKNICDLAKSKEQI
jgi:hypothetical protein